MGDHQRRYFQMALDAIERFESATTSQDLSDEVARATAPFGFRHFCLFAPMPPARRAGGGLLLRAWPEAWHLQYLAKGYKAHDPVSLHAHVSTTSFLWSDAPVPDHPLSREVLSMAASDYGMERGFCIPIHGLHGFQAAASFTGQEFEETRDALGAVETITAYAFGRLMRISERPAKSLTAREREIISWIAGGKTAWDIGVILHISENTVKKHMMSAMQKLNVSTRAQAVAESIRRGEISP